VLGELKIVASAWAPFHIGGLRAWLGVFFFFFFFLLLLLGNNFERNIELTKVKMLNIRVDSRNKRRGQGKIAKKNLLS